MKITSKTDYALRTVVDLALHGKNCITQASIISKRQHISRDYLGQILMILKAGGIVNSRRGLEGGYTLIKDPSEITLRSIVEMTNSALMNPAPPSETESVEERIISSIWNNITTHIEDTLSNLTIQDICDKVIESSAGQTNNYII